MVLGTRDYLDKSGFRKVLVGLSGGIDSALTATVAADALGRENVVGVGMPSRHSSEGSVSDSKELAEALGMRAVDCAHRAGPPGLYRHAGQLTSRAPSPTRRRRTCRPASGATFS